MYMIKRFSLPQRKPHQEVRLIGPFIEIDGHGQTTYERRLRQLILHGVEVLDRNECTSLSEFRSRLVAAQIPDQDKTASIHLLDVLLGLAEDSKNPFYIYTEDMDLIPVFGAARCSETLKIVARNFYPGTLFTQDAVLSFA